MSASGTYHTDGLRFGPTPTNSRYYLSMFRHRSPCNGEKTCWLDSIPATEEFGLFELADRERWEDSRGHMWAVGGFEAPELGKGGERLAKFPCPSNTTDDWHGFPIEPITSDPPRSPSRELIDRWEAELVVTRAIAKKLRQRKL